MFVSKSIVKAWTVDTHLAGKIAHGSRREAALPEASDCRIEDFVIVECTRARQMSDPFHASRANHAKA